MFCVAAPLCISVDGHGIFLSTSEASLTAAPGSQCKRHSQALTPWQSLPKRCSEVCPAAFGVESLGKACAEFRGVTPGCMLGPDDFPAAEIIYSLATGKR